MNTSAATELRKPVSGERVPLGTFGYFRTRNKNRVYSLVVREMDRAGISKAELARRLGKEPAQISRYLNGPGNWTLDTLSDFLFAISAAEADYKISYPLEKAQRNDTVPAWLAGNGPRKPMTQDHEKETRMTTPAGPKSAFEANKRDSVGRLSAADAREKQALQPSRSTKTLLGEEALA